MRDYMVLCTAKAHFDGCAMCDELNPVRGLPCHFCDKDSHCCKMVVLKTGRMPIDKDYKLESMPYAKCHVNIKSTVGGLLTITLISYATPVVSITTTGTVRRLWFSMTPTTARHINRFTREFTGCNMYHEIKALNDEMENYEVSAITVIDRLRWYLSNGRKYTD